MEKVVWETDIKESVMISLFFVCPLPEVAKGRWYWQKI